MWFVFGMMVGIVATAVPWLSFTADTRRKLRVAVNARTSMEDNLSSMALELNASLIENEELKAKYHAALRHVADTRDNLSRLINEMDRKSGSSSKITWLDVFGFSANETITKEKMEARYRALAKVYHPDLSGSDFAMKRLNQAKQIADKKFK